MHPKNRILVVDDDPINTDIIREIFEADCDLAFAEDGEEALARIKNFQPDLILLDIMLPKMDGFQVCKIIRDDPRYHFIKIILVSGKAELHERLKGYEAGADDYVTKPFIDEELQAKVNVFLKLKRAEEIDLIKSNLLTLFSHETRTPLNSIIGIGELLLQEKNLDHHIKTSLKMIVDSGYDLLDYIKKSGLLCELKSGITLEKTREHLIEHICGVATSLQAALERKNLTIHLPGKKDISYPADWALLDKAFSYVFNNAIKYSPEHGTVTVDVQTSTDGYYVKVYDEGSGISINRLDRIFDEFAIHDVYHHVKGQGLSLSIAKNIVELHGGKIYCENRPEKGAVFIFQLPLIK